MPAPHQPRGLRALAAIAALVLATTAADAGTITAVGAIDAMTDRAQFGAEVGTADWEFGAAGAQVNVPLNLYAGQGMTLHVAQLSAILAGVTAPGQSINPNSTDATAFIGGNVFSNPVPIPGGGSSTGKFGHLGGAATFAFPIDQFGLTFSRNGTQYITAWDTLGALIGQVQWTPTTRDAGFVGIDTRGVAIGMITVGNDDVLGGEAYGVGGPTIISDDWVWGNSVRVPEPGSLALFGLGGLGLIVLRRRRKRAASAG